jgi:hypothetical protein
MFATEKILKIKRLRQTHLQWRYLQSFLTLLPHSLTALNRRSENVCIRPAIVSELEPGNKTPHVVGTWDNAISHGGRAINALRSIKNTEYCPRRFRFTYVASRLI